MKFYSSKLVLGFLLTLFFVSYSLAQHILTGSVVDGDYRPVAGAKINVEGHKKQSTLTGKEGTFRIEVSEVSGVLEISSPKLGSESINFYAQTGKETDLGMITLKGDGVSLEKIEIVGSGIIDIVKDRQTPIAATTISGKDIQEKVGNLEFPEALKGVPSVFTMNTGGYGDGRYTVRGFGQENVLVLINGQPVNDMEWGGIYWSNWSGLTDVASLVQQQRGLGSSKIGIPSVGGTTNIITKATEKKRGGFLKGTYGNDNYFKTTLAYNSGTNENGWATSALISYWQGDGYMDATSGKGGTYFLSIGYKPSNEHNFNLTITGAPQQHDQDYREKISVYEKYGYRYNSNWGYRDGKVFSFSTNYYHKPIANFNWDWNINEKANLSTVVYGSWGLGGGTATFGTPHYKLPDDENGLIKVDDMIRANQGQSISGIKSPAIWNGATQGDGKSQYWNGKRIVTERGTGTVLRSSVNQHSWYGMLSNFDYKITDHLTLNTGIDLRTYVGKHYRVLNDLLGTDAYYDNADVNSAGFFTSNEVSTNPLKTYDLLNAPKLNRNYDARVRWAGWFGQLEYASESFTAFIQGSVSNQAYKRYEYFEVPLSQSQTNWSDIWGQNIKGGVNVILNEYNNIFFNAGYFSRQPFFNALYPYQYTSRANEKVDPKNEEIISYEAGYAYDTRFLKLVLNLYYSKWNDHYNSFSADFNGERRSARGYSNQLHKGLELEVTTRPVRNLSINGMFSYGDWAYRGNADITILNDLGRPEGESKLYLDKVEIGGAPQLQTKLGVKYSNLIPGLSFDADWYYNARNFSYVDASRFTKENSKNIKMPHYSLFDAGISYKINFDKSFAKSLNLRFNVNNLFDKLYIARGYSNIPADADNTKNWEGINKNNTVEFGFGRTWNVGATFNF